MQPGKRRVRSLQVFRRRRSGFSLIELLVVVVVVSVLCALVGPGLSRAKAVAVAAQCRHNVRQLTLALRLYVDDHACYPLFARGAATGFTFWATSLAPFVGAGNVLNKPSLAPSGCFMCPGVRKAGARDLKNDVAYGYVDRGYAFQGIGEKIVVNDWEFESCAVTEAEVQNPAETLAIADGIARLKSGLLLHTGLSLERWRQYEPVPLAGSATRDTPDLSAGDQRVRALHRGRLGAGYCDGHVEANKLNFLFDDTSDSALRRWNRDNASHREWLQP